MSSWKINARPQDLQSLKHHLLQSRGLEEPDLNKDINPVSLISSFPKELIDSFSKAKKLVLDAISEGRLIIIHGDYDADGVCATSILYLTITQNLNYSNVLYVIPDRFEDGYGLSDKTLKKILDKSFNQNFLLITVDSGITSINQVKELKRLGNQVIITDHHHQGDTLPEADVIVWSDQVVGSTLSWFLSLGLGGTSPHLLSLAGIATVTDVFPLRDFNRVLVKKSLRILRDSPPEFVRLLYTKLDRDVKKIDVYDLGFVIGPRLNSSGRLAHADTSVSLILSKDASEQENIISEINYLNQNRQDLTQRAIQNLDEKEVNTSKIVVYYNPDLHEGILGLIASKICQTYYKPAFVISRSGELLKGSARSIKGINVVELLSSSSSFLQNYGGHSLAGGFSLLEEQLHDFSQSIQKYAEENLVADLFEKIIEVEAELEESMINLELAGFLSHLEPFGQGNEEPIFLISNLTILEIKKIGSSSQHLNLRLQKNNTYFKAVVFNFDQKYENLFLGEKIDILFKLRLNYFNDKANLDLFLVDYRQHTDEA